MKIAAMQPYFFPFRGYFRLLERTDLFVVLDDVQHIRRGWVHRNRLRDKSGRERWLTLPLRKAPQDTLIKDMQFAPDALEEFRERRKPFGEFRVPLDVDGSLLDYLLRTMRDTVRLLGIPWNVTRSSELSVSGLSGQDRIIEICKRVGANRYLNAPGGRALYDDASFAAAGIELEFLPPWEGSYMSVLEEMRT